MPAIQTQGLCGACGERFDARIKRLTATLRAGRANINGYGYGD